MPLSTLPRRKFISIPDFIRSFLLRFQDLSSNATMSRRKKDTFSSIVKDRLREDRTQDDAFKDTPVAGDTSVIGAPFERFLEKNDATERTLDGIVIKGKNSNSAMRGRYPWLGEGKEGKEGWTTDPRTGFLDL